MEQEILYNILTGRYGEVLETHAMWECISALGIKPFKDGNQWRFLYGIIIAHHFLFIVVVDISNIVSLTIRKPIIL